MSTPRPAPITRPSPTAPDADWEGIRTRLLEHLAVNAAPAWTDHNVSDPGITLAEAAAFSLADLHYRTATRGFDDWPLEVRGWADDADRHWDFTLPAGRWDPADDPADPARSPADWAPVSAIADALAAPATSATILEPLLRAAASPADAAVVLSSPPFAAAFRPVDRAAVAALLRSRLVRRVAHDAAGTVAAALDAALRTAASSPAPGPTADDVAAAALDGVLDLWPDEIAALIRRERLRRSRGILADRLEAVRTATAATRAATTAGLAAAGLDADEARLAVAAGPTAAGLAPEDLEDAQGRTLLWPPHPIQALSCEPATAADYATRARADTRVARAWAVPGRLPGIAWNGLPTGTLPDIGVDPKAPALTLVVESRQEVPAAGEGNFLRQVLATAIGPEASAPFPDWRTDVDDVAPRRLIGDEVGAALLARSPVQVQATLVTAVGAGRDRVIDAARERLDAFLTGGRPGTSVPAEPEGIDGPWPRTGQPIGGWVPGEPVRFTEITEALVADPRILGVENLAMRLDGDPAFTASSAGALPIPGHTVPVLSSGRCLRVRFTATGGGSDG